MTKQVILKALWQVVLIAALALFTFNSLAQTPTASSDPVSDLIQQAQAGSPEHQYLLANRYLQGVGVPKDEREAVTWYQKAAEQGYEKAQYRLAASYFIGRGIPKNDREAAMWFRKSAEQGNPLSQYTLARMLRYNVGADKDNEEAREWYKRAANQGHGRAQYELGAMIWQRRSIPGLSSESVSKIHIEAYLWLSLAAQQGVENSEQLRNSARQRLTKKQLVIAQSLVTNWKAIDEFSE